MNEVVSGNLTYLSDCSSNEQCLSGCCGGGAINQCQFIKCIGHDKAFAIDISILACTMVLITIGIYCLIEWKVRQLRNRHGI